MNTRVEETLLVDSSLMLEVLRAREAGHSRSYVIDSCVFSRSLLTDLVHQRLKGGVEALTDSQPHQFSRALLSVKALVYVLPVRLGELLDALLFLVRFLYLHQGESRERRVNVVLLTDVPRDWLYNTMLSLAPNDTCLQWIVALSSRCRPADVDSVLTEMDFKRSLAHQAMDMGKERQLNRLSGKDVQVLWGLLHKRISLIEQARREGINISTMYSRYRSACRKLGADSLHCLIFRQF